MEAWFAEVILMHKPVRKTTWKGPAVTALLVFLLSAGLLALAGCESEQEKKAREFKQDYVGIMEAFEAKIQSDDKKAQALIEKQDLPGVINLVKQRISSVDDFMAELLALYPPHELFRLQGITIYYLITLKDRLEAQNAYYEAVLEGKPTEDLKAIQDQAIQLSQGIAGQLALELQKMDITLGPGPEQPPSTTPSTAPSTSP